MKLLLDECLPEDIKEFISGHEVFSVADRKWKGIKNGELMQRAVSEGFHVFLTADKNIRHQQNIANYQMAVIVFDVYRNTLTELRKKIPELYRLLPTVKKGNLYLC